MSDPLVLVTGATGTTGKLVVRELVRRGARVRAGVRSLEKGRVLLPAEVELAQMDYRLPESVEAAMKGVSRLFLLTPGGSEQVEQAWVAVEAARRAGSVERIVRLGSLLVPHRGPTTQVERWCHMTEQMVARSGSAFTFLRPTWFNQDFTELYFAPQVKSGMLLAPMGEGLAAWVDCRDVAGVAVAALLDPGHEGIIYSITGPEVLGVRKIVGILSRVAGRSIRYHNLPELPQKLFVRYILGMPPRDERAMLELIQKLRDGHLTLLTGDVEKVLGRPPIAFEQFAEDHAALLRR